MRIVYDFHTMMCEYTCECIDVYVCWWPFRIVTDCVATVRLCECETSHVQCTQSTCQSTVYHFESRELSMFASKLESE